MPSLRRLRPQFRPWADALIAAAKTLGQVKLTSAYRSPTDQRRLYNARQRGLHALPVAPPGCSLHEYGLAIDLVILRQGKRDDSALAALGAAARRAGLVWGGANDPVHFSWPASVHGC